MDYPDQSDPENRPGRLKTSGEAENDDQADPEAGDHDDRRLENPIRPHKIPHIIHRFYTSRGKPAAWESQNTDRRRVARQAAIGPLFEPIRLMRRVAPHSDA